MRNDLSGSRRWWIVAIVATVLFGVIAVAVASDSPLTGFDRAFAEALVGGGNSRWIRGFKIITLLGTGWTLGLASAVVALALLLRRQVELAIGWIVAQAGAVLLVKLVKAILTRDRPGLGDTAFYAHGWSFPSGHVVRTVAFFGVAAYLVFRLSGSRGTTMLVCALGVAWSVVMAFSRLYLGAHFASDVVAGLTLGLGWMAACIAALEGRKSSRHFETG